MKEPDRYSLGSVETFNGPCEGDLIFKMVKRKNGKYVLYSEYEKLKRMYNMMHEACSYPGDC